MADGDSSKLLTRVKGLKDYFAKQYAGQKDEKDIQTLPLGWWRIWGTLRINLPRNPMEVGHLLANCIPQQTKTFFGLGGLGQLGTRQLGRTSLQTESTTA